jgi:hypothetical protein
LGFRVFFVVILWVFLYFLGFWACMWVLASGFGLEGFQLVGLGLGFWAEGFLLVGLGFGIRARGFPACRVWVLGLLVGLGFGFWIRGSCMWVWASSFGLEGPACGFGLRV